MARPAAIAFFCLLLGATTPRPAAAAATPENEDAIAQLARLLQPAPDAAPSPGDATVFQILYWMRTAAVRDDFSPDGALRAAWQRAHPDAAQSIPSRGQLLADWHIASVYGLFTEDNLARLRSGAAPVATDGPFLGQTIQAVKINPGARADRVEGYALAAAGQPPAKDALASGRVPSPPNPIFNGPSAPPATSGLPTVPPSRPARLAANPGPANPLAVRNLPKQNWQAPGPPTVVTVPAQAAPPHILLQDVPFNGQLPLGDKLKLGIAGVTTNEISVSVVGERQVLVKSYVYGVRDTYVPSVSNYKVPKVNPVRLPGIAHDAYLIKDDTTGRYGGEVRYYYVDATVDNGAVFRIAKVTGGF